MDIIGVNVDASLVARVSTSFNELFSCIQPHWKKKLFREAVCVLIREDSGEASVKLTSSEYHFVLTVDDDQSVPVGEVVTEITLIYFTTLVNMDPVVASVFDELVQSFKVPREDALSALVMWVVSPEDVHLYVEDDLVMLCEQMDRELRGLYVEPVSHGLVVQ